MPKITDHPGVNIKKPTKTGYPFQLRWNHPLRNGQQVSPSIKTRDGGAACTAAKLISKLLRSPADWKQKPDYISDALWAVWQGDIVDQALAEAVRTASSRAPEGWEGYEADAKHFAARCKALQTAEESGQELERLRKDNAVLRAQNETLKGLLRSMGKQSAEDYAPKLFSEALKEYFGNTDKLQGKARTYYCWLKRFAEGLKSKDATVIQEVTGDDVIAHLEAIQRGDYIKVLKADSKKVTTEEQIAEYRQENAPQFSTIQDIAGRINSFLEHQTRGIYRGKQDVMDWLDDNNDDDVQQENPYWLDVEQVGKLCGEMNEFWADVTRLQFWGCFRPHELIHLQSAKTTLAAGDMRAEVARIHDGKRCVWKAKTEQSYGKVHLPEEVRATVERLRKRGRFLLIPDDAKLHKGTEHQYRESEEFERKSELWRKTSFCRQYLTILRAAATKAGLDASRVDSRTMRRSGGKRLLLDSGSMELTAAVLRDDPATVRKHYASLVSDDVKQVVTKQPEAAIKRKQKSA
jgi:hypothetical protein